MRTEFNGVTATATFLRTGTHDPFGSGQNRWDHKVWRVVLRTRGRRMQVQYYTGATHGKPTAQDVLECLVSDALTVDNTDGFEDWSAELGYDSDSRSAEATYRAAQRQTERLSRFLGDRYDDFLALEF